MYDLDAVQIRADSPIAGKTLYWLGSSVTCGSAAQQVSMVDYIGRIDQCRCVKNAVSGTTLFTDGRDSELSYVRRMRDPKWGFDPDARVDALFCQISTNDVKLENLAHMGEVRESYADIDMAQLDLTRTLDSLAYVIEYAHAVWHCPVFFYAGARFGDAGEARGSKDPSGSHYGALVESALAIARKYDALDDYTVKVLDLFHDEAFNALASDSDYACFMHDPVHPRQSGYLVWWVPYFQKFLYENLGQ